MGNIIFLVLMLAAAIALTYGNFNREKEYSISVKWTMRAYVATFWAIVISGIIAWAIHELSSFGAFGL